MPKALAMKRARRKARAGQKPTTQAGEFVREEMRRFELGDPDIKSRRQAIAIGLSEARRAGVALAPPKKGTVPEATRRKAKQDAAVGQGRTQPSLTRSRGAKKAARTRRTVGE